MQNKLYYAVTGQTAAEIVSGRADANKDNMGLTSWKGSPKSKILKSDIYKTRIYIKKAFVGRCTF